MNKWKVTMILKNGAMLRGIHNTVSTDIGEISKELVPNVNANSFGALMPESENEKGALIYAMSEVAAMRIEVME